jgi:hypothetical protein
MSTTDSCCTSRSGFTSTFTSGSGFTSRLENYTDSTLLRLDDTNRTNRINHVRRQLAIQHAIRTQYLSGIIQHTAITTPHTIIYRWYEILYSYSTDEYLTMTQYYSVFYTCFTPTHYLSASDRDELYSIFFKLCSTTRKDHIAIIEAIVSFIILRNEMSTLMSFTMIMNDMMKRVRKNNKVMHLTRHNVENVFRMH